MENKKIIKEVFKVYNDNKYREQFNNAEKMMKDLLRIALETQTKENIYVIEKHFKDLVGSTSCTCFSNETGLVRCNCCELKRKIGEEFNYSEAMNKKMRELEESFKPKDKTQPEEVQKR